jgi:hypothetical protein
MKIVSKRFLLTILLVLFCTEVFPQIECPCGFTTGSATIPPPPGIEICKPCPVAIDESIMVLVIIALVFGIYIIYKNNLKVKASI